MSAPKAMVIPGPDVHRSMRVMAAQRIPIVTRFLGGPFGVLVFRSQNEYRTGAGWLAAIGVPEVPRSAIEEVINRMGEAS